MKKFLLNMFSDKSDINPKVVVVFFAFVSLVVYGLTDIITGALGKQFVVEPIVFNGLLTLVIGAFGIAGLEAIMGNKNIKNEENPE